jgi:hypothetical protein
MLFVCWLWNGHGFWKQTARYNETHVAVLASMLKRHGGHELACVTNMPIAVGGVRRLRMPDRVAELPDYLPKLWAWSSEFHDMIDERFASIDLDVVLTGDIAPILQTNAPLRIWDHAKHEPYNTSLFSLEPGYGQEVWASYTPERVASARAKAGYWTGDQSWVAHVLGDGEETFGDRSGVIAYRPEKHQREMPRAANAVFFCGPYDPAIEAEQSEWIKAAWN